MGLAALLMPFTQSRLMPAQGFSFTLPNLTFITQMHIYSFFIFSNYSYTLPYNVTFGSSRKTEKDHKLESIPRNTGLKLIKWKCSTLARKHTHASFPSPSGFEIIILPIIIHVLIYLLQQSSHPKRALARRAARTTWNDVEQRALVRPRHDRRSARCSTSFHVVLAARSWSWSWSWPCQCEFTLIISRLTDMTFGTRTGVCGIATQAQSFFLAAAYISMDNRTSGNRCDQAKRNIKN